jgi:hypothetical protein
MNRDIPQPFLAVDNVADCNDEDDYAYHRDDTIDTRPSENLDKQVYKKTENTGDSPENGSGKT